LDSEPVEDGSTPSVGVPYRGYLTMSDQPIELTRRKALAALGTVGVASAGAGLGTTAYFSDSEDFEGNSLTAGSLDLKVDWEEHYSDWSEDEADGVSNVVMTDGDPGEIPAGYVGLPDPQTPLIAVPSEDLETFMDNTSIEAFPDPDNNGIQGDQEGDYVYDACRDGADTPEDLDPTVDGALRTNNEDTYDTEAEAYKPLIALDDVKPGDFGEATLSFHLCDNPGYVWLQGQLDEELTSENGLTEPEEDDGDEDQTLDEDGNVVLKDGEDGPAEVELLDEIQTTWWYDDDGDNVLDGGGGDTPCVQIVLDGSGSMSNNDGDGVSRNQEAIDGAKLLAQEIIDAGGRVGVTHFSRADLDSDDTNGAVVEQTITNNLSAVETAIESLPANGDETDIGDGILTADNDLSNCNDGERAIQVVVTDGQDNAGTDPSVAADDVTGSDSDDYTDEIFAIGTGGSSEADLLDFARPADDVHAEFTDDLTQVIANLSRVILGEKVIFRGSLRDALDALSDGDPVPGIPLDGNRATEFDEFEDDPTSENRECFVNSVEHYIGFAWYLPVNHANEIQTDSVGFDLGFYAEQCRHNDGAGQEAET
jgi:predicted ribosomally synthesized peptide with SipW-like signal peptide